MVGGRKGGEGRGGTVPRYATGQTRQRSIIGALITWEDLK